MYIVYMYVHACESYASSSRGSVGNDCDLRQNLRNTLLVHAKVIQLLWQLELHLFGDGNLQNLDRNPKPQTLKRVRSGSGSNLLLIAKLLHLHDTNVDP